MSIQLAAKKCIVEFQEGRRERLTRQRRDVEEWDERNEIRLKQWEIEELVDSSSPFSLDAVLDGAVQWKGYIIESISLIESCLRGK